MSWIGVECGVDAHELEKWGVYIERIAGGSGEAVGEFLRRCGRLVSGAEAGCIGGDDRMREIETRAMECVERKRNTAMDMAGRIVGNVVDSEDLNTTVGRVMTAAGMDGWRDGRASGGRNGGVKKMQERGRKRKHKFKGGGVVKSNEDGSLVSTIERKGIAEKDIHEGDVRLKKGGPPCIMLTLNADKCYAIRFESWAAVQMRGIGFKHVHIARALGMDKSDLWRHISGYERHWKRQMVAGVIQPEPSKEWQEALQNVIGTVTGQPGPAIVLNGTGKVEEREVKL